jgi:hypothetical protein
VSLALSIWRKNCFCCDILMRCQNTFRSLTTIALHK